MDDLIEYRPGDMVQYDCFFHGREKGPSNPTYAPFCRGMIGQITDRKRMLVAGKGLVYLYDVRYPMVKIRADDMSETWGMNHAINVLGEDLVPMKEPNWDFKAHNSSDWEFWTRVANFNKRCKNEYGDFKANPEPDPKPKLNLTISTQELYDLDKKVAPTDSWIEKINHHQDAIDAMRFAEMLARNSVICPADILKKEEETSMAIPTNALVPVKIIYNYPATIVFWKDGTKTVVQCSADDLFDEQAGFKAALAKKLYGHNHFIQKMVKDRSVYDKKHKVPDKRLRQRKPKVAKNAKPVTKNRSV